MAPYALFRKLWPAALCLVEVASAADGYVHLPFSRPQLKDLDLGNNGSRTLSDYVVPYLVQAQVGTPPQDFSLLISPTSTDTWVVDATTEYCDPQYYQHYYNEDVESDNVHKCVWGSFNQSESSTYRNANSRYDEFDAVTFSDYARGTNFTDKLVVGDLTFDNYPMGLVDQSNSWMGVLGLGHNYSDTLTRSSYSSDGTQGYYPTILDRMVSSGQISSPAYSIWLDSSEGASGSLLFGAIDKSRYTTDLLRVSATNPYALSGKFSVSVHSINTFRVGGPDGGRQGSLISNDLPIDVTIGMGELISFLPSDLVSNIASVVGATHDTTVGLYTIPCSAGISTSARLTFRLGGEGGPLLLAETPDLIIKPGVFNGQVSADKATELNSRILDLPDDTCVFGIQTWDDADTLDTYGSYSTSTGGTTSYYNLGNSLLRRSYLVFDLARQEFAVAPAAWVTDSPASPASSSAKSIDSSDDNIIPFSEYGAAIPESQYFCSDYEYYCPDDSINRGGGGGGLTHGDDASPTDEDYYFYGMRSSWKPISIALGVIFGTLVLVGLVVAGVLWKRVLRKDRRTMGLNISRDEEKRLMDNGGEGAGGGGGGGGGDAAQPMMMSPAAGDGAAAAGGAHGATVGGAASSGGPGLLPMIQEGREDDADPYLYLPARENEVSQVSEVPPVNEHANREQRLSAPDNLMDAPRSPSPLSEDGGMAGARAEAASPMSERLGTPPANESSRGKGKEKGKAVATENIGQAQ
ncbi:aspartic peptidase domain-containing protein [Sordaria sp. MPI-SDFR-AT-0083]|nr:aspartic peptidase domain-containing protein [Sordaria sp. MPI-SDFR-AT-0083]